MTAAQDRRPRTVPVYTVLPPDTLLMDVAGPLEVLRYANTAQADIRFDCRFLAVSPSQTTSIGLTVAGLEPLPEILPDGAMVIVSGSTTTASDPARAQSERTVLIEWLKHAIRDSTTLVTICSGALLAGTAGLLDGRDCTTHASCIDELKQAAPAARVLENRLYVEDGQHFSSAGISTGTDLMLHIVAKLTSPAVSLTIARAMVIYLRRSGGDPQLSPWLSGRNHVHPAVHRAQDAIMGEPARDWSMAALARVAHLSERHLSRLFREHTGLSVTHYLNLMRVTLARDILGHSRLDMESVAERCGFASPRHLRRVWSQFNDLPPSRFRESTVF